MQYLIYAGTAWVATETRGPLTKTVVRMMACECDTEIARNAAKTVLIRTTRLKTIYIMVKRLFTNYSIS